MKSEGLEVELRVTRLQARAAICAWLMLVCAETTISEKMILSTHYPVPSGIYEGLTVTGRSPAGVELDSFLTGGDPGSVGIRTGATDPLAKLVVGNGGGAVPGAMVLGSNVAPPNIPLTTQVLHTANRPGVVCAGAPGPGNACSGISLKTRNEGSDRWAMFPEAGRLRVRHTPGDGLGAGSQVMEFGPGGLFRDICRVVGYSRGIGASNPTACPEGHYVFAPWTGDQYQSAIPHNGAMLCCRIRER